MRQERQTQCILVTGGAGFIGSAFIRHVLSSEANFSGRCINLDALTYAGNLENLASVESDKRYCFVQGDIRDETLIFDLCIEHNVDTVIHFAAESHVDRSILGPKAFIDTNVLGTFSLLEVIRRLPHIHFHHVSTDEVYGSLGAEGLFTEDSPYRPNSPYSASKASSDHLVRAYHHTYGLSTCISNCSNNYGPFHFPEKLIPLIILNCFARKPLPIYGKGINIRDWLYVEDHAQALFRLLKCGRKGETYNIGGNAERRNIDVVQEIIHCVAELKGEPIENLKQLITFVKDRPGHDMRYAIDSTKIRLQQGWTPNHSFSEGLRKTVLWYKNNSEWVNHIQNGSYRQWMEMNYNGRG